MKPTHLLAAMFCLTLGGCASTDGGVAGDPLESYNRSMFAFNDTLDQYVAQPVAKGYQNVTPKPVRTGVSNFFANLGDVGNTINNLLQGKGADAADSFVRVAVNTIFGLGGLFDVATEAGVARHPQDVGLTLGTWNVPSGPYLVLPLFGPSTVRDGVGTVGDIYLDPVTYMDADVRGPVRALGIVNTRANLLGATDLLEQAALDKYTFVRDAYLQQRRYRLQKDADKGDLPNYEDVEPEKPPVR